MNAMERNNEIWLPVVGFEGLYEVSTLGRVKSLDRVRLDPIRGAKHYKCKILSPGATPFGYLFVRLSYKNKPSVSKLLHRLVADAFIPNPDNKPQVNHKNGIKSDNTVINLEWMTSSENVRHSFECLDRKASPGKRVYGKDHHLSRLIGIYRGSQLIGKVYGQREASILSEIPHGSVNTSLQRNCEVRGFRFKYE